MVRRVKVFGFDPKEYLKLEKKFDPKKMFTRCSIGTHSKYSITATKVNVN